MARLPQPGADEGVWGDVLNNYLSTVHNPDGTLKDDVVTASSLAPDAVSPANLQDNSVTEPKLNISNTPTGGQILGFDGTNLTWTNAAAAPDATTGSKGIVQLAGDLSGTAAAPTVPGLAGKVDTTRTITAGTGLSGGGDLSANRTLTVTDDTTTQKVELAKAGTLQGTRKQINLIEGTNVTLTTADNPGSNRVDVTIAASGGATPATTVVSETTYGASSTVGVATNYAREDHTHGTPALSSVVSLAGAIAGSAGVATVPARGDHVHPITQIEPSSYNYIGWNYPLFLASAGTVLGTAGTLYVCKVPVPASTTITNVIINLANAGITLTAGQSFAALYSAAGNLLSTTADQSSTWTSGGNKIMALSAAQAVSAGYVYIGFFSNGTTLPGPARTMANTSYANGGLSAANSLWATCSNGTGLTTTMPATLGTLAAFNTTYWAGVS